MRTNINKQRRGRTDPATGGRPGVPVVRARRIDPADLTFFGNLFSGIAREMGVVLGRTAFSANIKERRDLSCAMFDGEGSLVAQAAHIPVHLGAMPLCMESVLHAIDPIEPGDLIMLNDPFAGGTHLPDITLVSPVFAEKGGRPFALLASRAHHADVGGISPGSMPVAREIFQEGIRIPPIKLHERGRPNHAVLKLLLANVRTPEERLGDLRAQIAAHETGRKRLCQALAKYGASQLRARMADLLGYGERLMRSVAESIPDGVHAFEDFLDGDGVEPGPIRIRATVTVRGAQIVVDFTGSDPSCAGSLNAVEAVTRSAVYYVFLCLLATPPPGDGFARPGADPPFNAGCLRPIRVVAPRGTIVNALPPHAVAAGNVETSQRIVDVVFGALAAALPDRIPAASQGTMNNVTVGGIDARGRPFAYYETIGGGMGARPGAHGIDAVHVHMTNTLNTPIEALEYAFPLRVERYEILRGTGGRGRFRGGHGVCRAVRMLAPARATVLSERRTRGPYGLQGGSPGRRGANAVIRKGRRILLPGKFDIELREGDILEIRTPGGGGWGAPEGGKV